jgi:hypothetical protein
MISPDAFLALKRERSELLAEVGSLQARIRELELALAAAAADTARPRPVTVSKPRRPELTAVAV